MFAGEISFDALKSEQYSSFAVKLYTELNILNTGAL